MQSPPDPRTLTELRTSGDASCLAATPLGGECMLCLGTYDVDKGTRARSGQVHVYSTTAAGALRVRLPASFRPGPSFHAKACSRRRDAPQELCSIPSPAVFDGAWRRPAGREPLLLGVAGADGAVHLYSLQPGQAGWAGALQASVSVSSGSQEAPLCTSFDWAQPGAAASWDVCTCGQDGRAHLIALGQVRRPPLFCFHHRARTA